MSNVEVNPEVLGIVEPFRGCHPDEEPVPPNAGRELGVVQGNADEKNWV